MLTRTAQIAALSSFAMCTLFRYLYVLHFHETITLLNTVRSTFSFLLFHPFCCELRIIFTLCQIKTYVRNILQAAGNDKLSLYSLSPVGCDRHTQFTPRLLGLILIAITAITHARKSISLLSTELSTNLLKKLSNFNVCCGPLNFNFVTNETHTISFNPIRSMNLYNVQSITTNYLFTFISIFD